MAYLYIIAPVIILFFIGIRIVRPTQRGLIERLGKYHHIAHPGFHWIIPIIDRLFLVNVTEQMVDVVPQEISTNNTLNARVDAKIYYRVKSDEESVKGSIYNENTYKNQIVNLVRTALRNSIGTLTLKSANSERWKINADLCKTLHNETQTWGIEIVRTELKEIDPPKDVQETVTDGITQKKIKESQSFKQSKILYPEREAEAPGLVSEAAKQYFAGNAQLLRKLEVLEISIGQSSKIVIPAGSTMVNSVGVIDGILTIDRKQYQ